MAIVSVVIPVYNVGNYLCQCLDSVINQNLKNIEIICVNDCSTDNSKRILEEYKTKDNRITIVNHKWNRGLSISRNTGLYQSSSEYIYFLDSDDWIEPDTLEKCYKLAVENSLDVVSFDGDVFVDANHQWEDNFLGPKDFSYVRENKINNSKIYDGKEFLKYLLKNNIYKSSACLNLISFELLKKYNIDFYPKIFHEDEIFALSLYSKANRVMHLPCKFFKRRIRSGSIMSNRKTIKNIYDLLIVSEEVYKLYKNEDEEELKTELKKKFISIMTWTEQIYNETPGLKEDISLSNFLGKNYYWKLYFKQMKGSHIKSKVSSILRKVKVQR